MIDADPRVAPQVAWTLRRNKLDGNGIFKLGMIAEGAGERDFALRQGMGSSSELDGAEQLCRVPCITAEQIAAMFPPPYDLIKIDIEGAEYAFARNYRELCREAAWLLVEWHSQDREGKREAELRRLCEENGFEYFTEVRKKRELCVNGAWNSSGVQLYRRK